MRQQWCPGRFSSPPQKRPGNEATLTPAHLLVGRRVLSLPDYVVRGCEEDIDGVGPDLLDRRAKHLNIAVLGTLEEGVPSGIARVTTLPSWTC